MLYFFRFLLILININQETVLNWFGIEDSNTHNIRQAIEQGYQLDFLNLKPSLNVSLETIRLILNGLWDKIQSGLTLADIENVLFFILFIRFVILSIRYNLKTSFYITCIGLFAGYLWYRHLIDLISMYRTILLKLPFFHKFGIDAFQLGSVNRQMALTDLKLEENTHWYNPGQVLYYAFTKGIRDVDLDSGLRYYIDPISMFISNLQESTKSQIVPLYYKIYNKILPKIYDICSKFWNQLSGVAAYAVITRIGKRYCPYLVRWHWTFLLIISMIEQIFIYFIYRVYYFQSFVLMSQINSYDSYFDQNLIVQINALNAIIICVGVTHIGFVLFGLFHAIWGQYFYLPFFVENTELHIGPRPKNSIYSGGNTAWQDLEEKEKGLNRRLPKLWYGWFGNGDQSNWEINLDLKKFIKKIIKKFKR
jgi:Uncharacterised protein family